MEKIEKNEENIDLQEIFYTKLSNLKTLELINTDIYICGLNIDSKFFENIKTKEDNKFDEETINIYKKLTFFSNLIIEILNKTEKLCKINILFENLKDKSLGFYENILCYLFSIISIQSKFLESKKLIITFPQILSNEYKEYKSNLNNFEYEKNFQNILEENLMDEDLDLNNINKQINFFIFPNEDNLLTKKSEGSKNIFAEILINKFSSKKFLTNNSENSLDLNIQKYFFLNYSKNFQNTQGIK